ncbi:MAG: tetratricopeptide repeat protein [Bdellovibrionales bacterium]|nr:tetratricopeptide repeat protein [Bdellovibrionales bacterium]
MQAPPIYDVAASDDHAIQNENKEARLLVTLFNNRRQGLFLATAKDFLKKYPKTQYDEIIRYMMADTHYDLWHKERLTKEENKEEGVNLHDTDFEEAMGIYNNLIEKYPDSPLTTRTLLLVGYSYLERGDSFGALKTFQRFVRLKPDSKYAGQVKISIARAFMALNRHEDAIKELESVGERRQGSSRPTRGGLSQRRRVLPQGRLRKVDCGLRRCD